MSTLLVKAAGLTDPGRTRLRNEDALWVDAERGLLIVADGLGGHKSGEIASGMAVRSIPVSFEQLAESGASGAIADQGFSAATNRLGYCLKMANQMIFEAASREPKDHGMGTTCTAALISAGRLSVAHVGDSRCYLIRNARMQQLTQDHSLLMERIRLGLISRDDTWSKAGQNILTRSLGTNRDVMIDLDEHSLSAGDVLLLCTDGLDKELTDDQVLQAVITTSEPSELTKRLVDMANAAGGRDNITVVVARIDEAGVGSINQGLP